MANDIRLYNVVMLGVCFMLIFTAFQTSGNVQVSISYLLTYFIYINQQQQPSWTGRDPEILYLFC